MLKTNLCKIVYARLSSTLSSVLYFLKTLPLSSIIPNLNASVLLKWEQLIILKNEML